VTKTRNAYTSAVEWLAAECQERQFDTTVMLADAMRHIDPEVIHVWTLGQLRDTSYIRQLMADSLDNLSDIELATVWIELPYASSGHAIALLAKAQATMVAKRMVEDAQALIDNFDPGDAEVERNNESLMDLARAEARGSL
jgi:hypothetical protein